MQKWSVVFRNNFNELLEDQRLLEVQKLLISEVQTQLKLLAFGALHYRRKECVLSTSPARKIKVSSKYIKMCLKKKKEKSVFSSNTKCKAK